VLKEPSRGFIDHGADDVRWQHVRSELQALKVETNRRGERLERERFCEARHAFKKDVAVAGQVGKVSKELRFESGACLPPYLGIAIGSKQMRENYDRVRLQNRSAHAGGYGVDLANSAQATLEND
jgi:hypothetical protein